MAGSFVVPAVSPAQVSAQSRKAIIIGAGLSGLVAAYELRKLNFDITVLEAQSRPGGRVLTLRNFDEAGLYAEAGAARIPSDHDLTLKYVREFALPLVPFYPATGTFMRLKGGRAERVGWDKFSDASMFVSLDDQDAWQKIRGGNDQLPRAFANKLGSSVRYDSAVVRIEQGPSNVTVKFKEQETVRSIGRRRRYLRDTVYDAVEDRDLAGIQSGEGGVDPLARIRCGVESIY
jgi:monoamine oxidase